MARRHRHRRHNAHHRRHHARHHYRRHHNPHRRRHGHHRHRVHNPLTARGLTNALMPAAIGASGAIAVDVGLAYASPYLPAVLASGWGRIAAQVVAAFGMGYVATKVGFRRHAHAIAAGALTVTAYSAIKQVLAPTLGTTVKGLSGLADFTDYRYGPDGAIGAYQRPGVPVPSWGGQSFGDSRGGYINGMGDARGGFISGRGFGRLGAYMNPAPFVGSSGSPIAAKQLSAYMTSGMGGGSDMDMAS